MLPAGLVSATKTARVRSPVPCTGMGEAAKAISWGAPTPSSRHVSSGPPPVIQCSQKVFLHGMAVSQKEKIAAKGQDYVLDVAGLKRFDCLSAALHSLACNKGRLV